MQARLAGGQLADLGRGEGAAVGALKRAQLALGEDALVAVALAEGKGDRGAAQPVGRRARRDLGDREAEGGVARPCRVARSRVGSSRRSARRSTRPRSTQAATRR